MTTQPNSNPSKPQNQPPDQPQPTALPPTPEPPKKRRRGRRILTVLAVLFVMLAGAVIALPYLASTAWATQKIVGTVNGRIDGELALDRLSLAWFRPCKLSGIRVNDPSDREVVVAESIAVQGGVWGLVKAMGLPKEIQIQAPKVTLYVTDSGGVSLADAFASGKPAEPSESESKAKLPDLRVVISDGQVKLVQPDGKVTETVNLSADARLASAGDVLAKLDAQMASGGKLTGDVGLKNLITAGQFDVSRATGNVKLKTDQPLQIKPVAEAFMASPLEGQVALDINGEIISGGFKGKLQTDLKGVRTAGDSDQGLAPIDVALRGDVSYTPERLEGVMDLEGDAGTAQVKFGFDPQTAGSMTPADEIATRVLAGKSLTLPTIEADVRGQIDLAALAKMLGGVLPLKEGATVNSGSMMIHDLKLRGGAEPSLSGRVEVTSLSATAPSGPINIAPIEARAQIASSAASGVSIQATQLKSDFATIDVEGTPQQITATIIGDLDRLQQNVSQLVDLGESRFAGKIDGRVTVKRSGDEKVDVNALIKGTNVRYGEREIAQLEVGGDVAYSPERIDGTLKLDGSPGTANVKFGYLQQDAASVTPPDELASVILSGGSLTLPQFEADVQGRLDLPAVARLLGDALPLKEGTSVTGGSLVIHDLKARGGAEPTLTGVVELTGASATSPSGPIRFAPIEAKAQITSSSASGINIQATQLTSDFATIMLEGTPQEMTATLTGDLDRLQQNLSQLVDLGESRFAGQVDGRIAVKRSGDEKVDVNAAIKGTNVRFGERQIAQLDIGGDVSYTKERVNGAVNLDGSAGTANVKFGYDQRDSASVTPGDEMVSVILSGGSPTLPQFEADVQGRLDLPAVARLLGEALPLKQGTSVTAGSLVIQDLKLRGGAEPSLSGAIELTGASATSPSGPINIAPIEARAEVTSTASSGVSIRATQLKSDFAQIDVEGTPQQMTATVSGDLDRLQQNLSQVVDMGDSRFAGRFNGRFDLKRSSDERFDLTAQLDAENLQITQPDGSLKLNRCTVRHDGHVELPEGKQAKIVSKQTQLDIDQAASVLASGSYDLNDSAFSAQVDLSRLDLGFVNRQASLLGVGGLSGMDGTVTARTTLTGSAGGKLSGDGEWQVTRLVLDGKPVTDSMQGRLSGLSLDTQARQCTVNQAKVDSTIAKLDADGVHLTWGDALNLAGRIQVGAELAQAIPVIARVSGWQDPPRMKGRVAINSNVKSEGEGFAALGTGTIDGFEMATESGAMLRDRFQFEWDAAVARSPEQIKVRKLSAQSNMLTTSLSGQVDDYAKTCRLNLSGDYKLDWAKVNDLIHTLAPSTKSTVSLAGQPTGRVVAAGALFGPDAGLALEGLNAEAGTGWSSASIYGVDMQQASFKPVMRNGVLALPETAIGASGGTVRLAGQVDMRPETPVLRIPGQLKMLDKVMISKQLGEELLGRINPMFVQMAEVEGQIDMSVQSLELPLGESITHGGGGGGAIDLRALKIQPGGFMAHLMELGGLGSREKYGMTVGKLVFTVRDGRIWYDNLTVDFGGQYDLAFRGSVGFDDTLDLIVSMPVRAALLERLRVSGPVLEYARKLEGTRVEAPLVGTRKNPNLDLSKVDTTALLKDVIQKTAINDLLKGLQGTPEKKEQPPAEERKPRPRRIKRDN